MTMNPVSPASVLRRRVLAAVSPFMTDAKGFSLAENVMERLNPRLTTYLFRHPYFTPMLAGAAVSLAMTAIVGGSLRVALGSEDTSMADRFAITRNAAMIRHVVMGEFVPLSALLLLCRSTMRSAALSFLSCGAISLLQVMIGDRMLRQWNR